MNYLDHIPKFEQRQDFVLDQLADLMLVANRLGMFDAADAIRQWCKDMPKLEYGCYIDIEPAEEPDECVLDISTYDDCIYAEKGMRKEQCEYWRPK